MDSIELTSTGLIVSGTSLDRLQVSQHLTIPSISCLELLSSSGVLISGNGLLTSVSLPSLKSFTGSTNQHLWVNGNPSLASINLNALISVSSSVNLSVNPQLTAISLGALIFVNGAFVIQQNSALVTLSLPNVVSMASSVFTNFLANDCVSLSGVSFPKYLPTKGHNQIFNGCALTETSVDHILARCVASANYTSGTVNLSGGTNAVPGTQGQLDKATLIARGCTVLTN